LALGLVGAVAGVVWWWISPQPGYRIETDGLYFLSAQPQQYIAADGWFAVLTVTIGLAAGITVWVRCSRDPLAGLLGLAVGGLVGAAVTATVGMVLGRSDPYSGPVGTLSQGPLEIRAWSVLLLEAGMAVAAWLIIDVLVVRSEVSAPEPSARPELDPLPGQGLDPVLPPRTPDAGDVGYGAARDL
jgi:hypothetical protein